jgi:hypothetical protein
MGFNIFLYAFIIFGILVGKSYDYQPSEPSNKHEESEKND